MTVLHRAMSAGASLVGGNRLSILIYHQVLPEPDPMRAGEPDARTFRWHMALISRYFRPMSLDEAARQLREGCLPPRAVAVTFDDGYLNNLEVAQPILAEFKVPATVFVATAFSNGGNMWNDRIIDLLGNPGLSRISLDSLDLRARDLGDVDNRLSVARELLPRLKYLDFRKREVAVDTLYQENNAPEAPRKMMSHQEVAKLQRLGVSIGAHTVNHPILRSLSPAEQRLEIEGSKRVLESVTGAAINSFAYPNGRRGDDYDDLSVQLVREAGFEQAVSTTWGVSTQATSNFELRRSTPWDSNGLRFHLRMLRNIVRP